MSPGNAGNRIDMDRKFLWEASLTPNIGVGDPSHISFGQQSHISDVR
jgi:hypothetical protein